MFPRSIYLRDQAAKCWSHTIAMSDAETQAALRELADEYVAQAEEIESKENKAAIDNGTSAQRGLVVPSNLAGAMPLSHRADG